jgi:glucose/arabinose dehydrogenase
VKPDKQTNNHLTFTNDHKIMFLGTLIMIGTMFAVTVGWIVVHNKPQDVTYTFDVVIQGMAQPVGITNANDERLFINERNGVIRILDTGKLLDQPFLDIRDRVNIEGNIEQGILGLAFDPNYAENGYFYVSYTDADYTVHLERFQVTDDPNVADPESSMHMLLAEQKTSAHNGGHLRFGKDGYLYVSIGDGGESIQPDTTGQKTDNFLGKLLRLDVSGDEPYEIPEDNPFVDNPDYRPEIWALGFRNPWQFSFAPDSDAIFISDVGWSTYEEINYQPAGSTGGENYGWKIYEANDFIEQPEEAEIFDIPADELVFPIYFYPHATPKDYDGSYPVGCAIIGGFVYRGEALPQLQGKYIYGDFCNGQVWTLTQHGDKWETELLVSTNLRITSLGEDSSGEIYLTSFLGDVRKLIIDSEGKYAPDGDLDFDLVPNGVDNCPEVGNPDQSDTWGDLGVGDVCDQNFYTNGSSVYEVKIFQQHYGAFHIYGCEGVNCGFVAILESAELSPDTPLQIESENFTGWTIEATYFGMSDDYDIYNIKIYDADGNVYVDNLQILKSDTNVRWRTIS